MPVDFPKNFLEFLDIMSTITLMEMNAFVPLECIQRPRIGFFYWRLLIFTLFPIAFGTALFIYYLIRVSRVQDDNDDVENDFDFSLSVGDDVDIHKEGSTKFGLHAVVIDANWNSMVKVQMVESKEIKSYKADDLVPHMQSTKPMLTPKQTILIQVAYFGLFFLAVVLVPVSSKIFQTFSCEEVDTGLYVLRRDNSQRCWDSPKHRFFQVFAGVAFCIYPVGVPLVFFSLLFNRLDSIWPKIKDRRASRSNHSPEDYRTVLRERKQDTSIFHLLFLFESFHPGYFYWETWGRSS